MYVYVAYVVQYLSHVVVTHCVWPVSIAFILICGSCYLCSVVCTRVAKVLPVS